MKVLKCRLKTAPLPPPKKKELLESELVFNSYFKHKLCFSSACESAKREFEKVKTFKIKYIFSIRTIVLTHILSTN